MIRDRRLEQKLARLEFGGEEGILSTRSPNPSLEEGKARLADRRRMLLAPALVERLHRRANAARWSVPADVFATALEQSLLKSSERKSTTITVERQLESLHLEDLALACGCASGDDAAWEHFILTHRPVLYRSADAIDPTGGARELADALYADLYGTSERDGKRQSLFRYFHGRSTLATWLRAVLAQRYVDHVREARRLEPLPEPDSRAVVEPTASIADPHRALHIARLERALARALAGLASRDRLRLGCYYAQNMTLAEIGVVLREHEASVSRHLKRTRRGLRDAIEDHLRTEEHLSADQIKECLASSMDDAGSLDLADLLATASDGKNFVQNRSIGKKGP